MREFDPSQAYMLDREEITQRESGRRVKRYSLHYTLHRVRNQNVTLYTNCFIYHELKVNVSVFLLDF